MPPKRKADRKCARNNFVFIHRLFSFKIRILETDYGNDALRYGLLLERLSMPDSNLVSGTQFFFSVGAAAGPAAVP